MQNDEHDQPNPPQPPIETRPQPAASPPTPQPTHTPSNPPRQPQQHAPGDQFHPDGTHTPASVDNTQVPQPPAQQPATPPTTPINSTAPQATVPTAAPQFNGVTPPSQSMPLNQQRSKRPYLAATGSFAVVILAAAFYFFSYLPNTPENVYRRGMASVGVGLEELVTNDTIQPSKATEFSGTLTMTEPTEVTANISGSSAVEGDGEFTIDVAWDRYNPTVDFSVATPGSGYPQVFFRFDGVREVVDDNLGPGTFNQLAPGQQLENVWWLIDFEEFINQGFLTQQEADELLAENQTSVTTDDYVALTEAAINASKDHLFTADTDKMVLQRIEDRGTEDFEGVESRKYLAEINRENLKAYLKSLRDNIAATGVLEKIDPNLDLNELMPDSDIDAFADEFDLEGVEIEVWVGLDNKVLRNIRFTETESGAYFEASLLLENDNLDRIPLRFRAAGEDDQVSSRFDLNWIADVPSNTFEYGLDIDVQDRDPNGLNVVLDMQLKFEGLAEAPAYEIPAPSRSFLELLDSSVQNASQVLGISTDEFEL